MGPRSGQRRPGRDDRRPPHEDTEGGGLCRPGRGSTRTLWPQAARPPELWELAGVELVPTSPQTERFPQFSFGRFAARVERELVLWAGFVSCRDAKLVSQC